MGRLPPQEESNWIADQITCEHFHSVVINIEHAAFDQGLAQALSEHLKAPCFSLTELKAENLYKAVSQAKTAIRDEKK